MKYLLTIFVMLMATSLFAQEEEIEQIQTLEEIEAAIEKENASYASTDPRKSKNIVREKGEVKETRASRRRAAKQFQKMARARAQEIQKDLELNNYASLILEQAIYKYSVKANKVIQSGMSAQEKSRQLTNIIYFQNEELKKVFTVPQFYKYLKLTQNQDQGIVKSSKNHQIAVFE